jgi:hypothetical protein
LGALLVFGVPRLVFGSLAILRDPAAASRTDFAWMYVAMRAAWLHVRTGAAATALYQVAAERAFMRAHGIPFNALDLFGYPPPFAAAFAWLGALPYDRARTVWTLLSAAWFLGAVAFGWALARPGRDWRLAAAVAGIGLSCFSALTTFYWGQSDTLILLCVAAGLWCFHRARRPAAGGVLLGAATVLKVIPGVLVLYFAARWVLAATRARRGGLDGARRERAARDGWMVVGAAAGAAGLTALSVLMLGPGPFVDYLVRTLPAVQRIALAVGPAPMEQSVRGVLLLFLGAGLPVRILADLLAVAALAAALAAADRSARPDPAVEAAAVGLLPLVCSPSVEGHFFVLAVLPEMALAGWLLRARFRWRGPVAAAFAAGVLLLTIPGEPFLPALGRPLCSLPGQPGLLQNSGLGFGICVGQHLWGVLLLFGVALLGLALPAAWRPPRWRRVVRAGRHPAGRPG